LIQIHMILTCISKMPSKQWRFLKWKKGSTDREPLGCK
jgi:hypothetical protein